MNAVELKDVGKRYQLGGRQQSYLTIREALSSFWLSRSSMAGAKIWALKDIDLEISSHEVTGIIGRNGAGKSTLLKLITGITAPTTGVVRTRGRVGALLEVGTGFHPELTGRENVFLNAAVLGMSRRDARKQFNEIVSFAGVEEFIDTPLKRYSTGMRLRLAFAVAAHIRPPIVVVDEVLSVADAEFQQRCLGKMEELGAADRTVLFVSHDLGAIAHLCQRVIWIDAGVIEADGPPDKVIERYLSATALGTPHVDLGEMDAGPIQLLDAAIVDAEGHPQPTLVRGDPLYIRIVFAVRTQVRAMDITMWVEDRRGVGLINEAWADTSDGVPSLNLSPGEYACVLGLPPVLPSGQFTIGVWFGNELEDYLTRTELMAIEIIPRHDDRQESLTRRRAIRPDVSWQLDVLRPNG
jgi:homopolymeric O-antigen transport system ATP-binding protein